MQRPSQFVITTSGTSTPIPLDYYTNGYGVTVTMKTAGAIYTLQYSNDDPNFDAVASQAAGQNVRYTTSYAVSGTWLNSDDPIMVNASTNRSSNFAYPPRAIRLNVTAKVSAGNPVVLTIVPLGADGG